MPSPQVTCWTLVEAAGSGGAVEREEVARRYVPAGSAYFAARWKGKSNLQDVDDAAQEVFVEVFRDRGVLERADRLWSGGFRAYLYGVARNVARRFEQSRAKAREQATPPDLDLDSIEPEDETSLSLAFDRAWALSLLRQAFDRLRDAAGRGDARARRRVELLQLRFQEGLPIRDIADRWQLDAAAVHEQYRQARED